MADYRQIQCSFWRDPFVLGLTPEERYFYLYLLSNGETTQCGAYELPLMLISFETGYNAETVGKLLGKFESYKKILYDRDTQEVLIFNWLKHNWIASDKVIARTLADARSIKSEAIRKYMDTVLIGYGYSLDRLAEEENRREEEKKEKKKEKTNGSLVDLPGWLNKPAWEEWIEFRKEIKKPLTTLGAKKCLAVLEAHQAQQKEIIDTSIARGWTGLFPPKEAKASGNKPPREFPR